MRLHFLVNRLINTNNLREFARRNRRRSLAVPSQRTATMIDDPCNNRVRGEGKKRGKRGEDVHLVTR